MTAADILKAAGASMAGVFVGWAGAGLTLTGRVDAIESTLQRIESRIDVYIAQQMAPHAEKKPAP